MGISRRFLFLWVLALCLVGGRGPARAQDAPSISRLTDLVEWVIDIPLTEAQRSSLGVVLTSLPSVRLQAVADDAKRLESIDSPQRSRLRPELRSQLLGSGDAIVGWVQQTESEAGQIVVGGDPPLTQQTLACFTEWLLFALDPTSPVQVSPQLGSAIQAVMTQLYPELDSSQRAQLNGLPRQWASLRKKWPDLSQSQRDPLIAHWKTLLGPLFRRQDKVRLAAAALAAVQQAIEQNVNSATLAPKLARIRFLSTSLRQEKDPQCSSLADQLDLAIFNIQQGQQQEDTLQGLNELSAQIAERSQLPGTDTQSLKPLLLERGGIFVGGNEGLPYRF